MNARPQFVSPDQIDILNAALLELYPDGLISDHCDDRRDRLAAVALLCGYRPAEPWELRRYFASQHVNHCAWIFADANGAYVAAYTPLISERGWHEGLENGRFEDAREYKSVEWQLSSRLAQLIGALRAGE